MHLRQAPGPGSNAASRSRPPRLRQAQSPCKPDWRPALPARPRLSTRANVTSDTVGVPTAPAAPAATAATAALGSAAAAAAPAARPSGVLAQAVADLKARLEEAVLAEAQEQQRQQVAAYSRSSAQRLQAEGVTLLGLLAEPQGRLYTDFVWSLHLPARPQLPYHRFKRGDTVLLGRSSGGAVSRRQQSQPQPRSLSTGGTPTLSSSSGDEDGPDYGSSSSSGNGEGMLGGEPLEGTVLEVRREEVLVTVAKPVAEVLGAAPTGARWRLDQGVSSATTRRQLAALNRLGELQDPNCRGEAAVRALLLRTQQPEATARRPTAWAQQEEWRADAGQQLQHLAQLNSSQRRAVATALTRTLTLWQGPPGTGKTRTLLAFVEVVVRTAAQCPLRRRDMGAVLAVADTNAAADNLLEGLLQRGIQAVRVGQPAKVRPELRHACIDAQVERTRAGQRAVKLRSQADELLQHVRQLQQQELAAQQAQQQAQAQQQQQEQVRWQQQQQQGQMQQRAELRQQAWQQQQQREQHVQLPQQAQQPPPRRQQRQGAAVDPALLRDLQQRADALWREADDLEAGAAAQLLRSAPVVVATCNGSGEGRLEGQRFRVVALDEASQATEASSLVPLVKGAECVVMAGDQKQLPPTVLSQRALELGLGVPLFTRLLESGVQSMLLDEQYRMHPAIAEFPSVYFYGGRVQSGVTAADRPPVQGVPWSNPNCPVLFINVDGVELRASGGGSGGDRQQGGATGDGGGASYRNHAEAEVAMKALQRLLQQDNTLQSIALLSPYSGQVRLLSSLLSQLKLPREVEQRCALTVSTVDGYQGREADCVIFSAVRCNEDGRVGFLSDERRLNVAISRPRRGLIVIGNQATLKHNTTWRTWMHWVAQQRRQRAQAQDAAAAPPTPEQQQQQQQQQQQRASS